MNKFERNSKIIMGIENLANWKPNLKKIADKHNMPISTVNSFYNRLKQQNRIKLYVQVLTEEEAHTLFLEKQLKEKREAEYEKDFQDSKDNAGFR